MAYKVKQELVTLQTLTASASATLSFTSLITSNFNVYAVKGRDIVSATNNTLLRMTFSTNNGSTYLSTNYQWAFRVGDSAGFQGIVSGTASNAVEIKDAVSNVSTRGLSFDMLIYNLNSGTFSPSCMWSAGHYDSNGNNSVVQGYGANTTTTAITALRFLMSSGNLTSGTFTLYGVQYV